MTGNINFSSGSSMEVQKLYKVDFSKDKALDVVLNAVKESKDFGIKDNSDYVLFEKDNATFLAVGKGNLLDVNKNVKIGVETEVKFLLDGEEHTASEVVNKTNTIEEWTNDKNSIDKQSNHQMNRMYSAGVGSLVGFIVGEALDAKFGIELASKIGLAAGTALGIGVCETTKALGDAHTKKEILKPNIHTGIDYLADKGFLKEVK